MPDTKYKNIAIVGDNYGIPALLKYIPVPFVKCIIAAEIRPQYIDLLRTQAELLGIKFLVQPRYNSKNYLEFYKSFCDLKIDLLFCHSYSMILREEILKEINYNAVNLHCSLLPLNRGPHPENWTIIKGEEITGATLHYMDDEVDSGDIIAQEKITIDFEDTWVSLLSKMEKVQEKLLTNEVINILSGCNDRIKQNEAIATINKKLNPDFPRIDFNKMNDLEIYNLIRAQVYPLKGAYIERDKVRIYIDKLISIDEIKKLRVEYA